MTTPADVVIEKLRQAEDQALAVLRAFGLPLELDDLWLSEDSQFKDASDRNRQRISAAVNVLISVREVHRRRALGDHNGALRFMAYVEQGPNLLDHARRGAKTVKAASSGGKSEARVRKAEASRKAAQWRRAAVEIWQRRPEHSARSVAAQISNKTKNGDSPETIRKQIADLKPPRK